MEAKELIQIPAQVIDLKPYADKSWKLVFNTRELTGEEVALVADSLQGEGWLVYSPNKEVTDADIPETKADSGGNSPSQRRRAIIFVLWKQRGSKGDFETFYRVSIEKLIEHIGAQLEEENEPKNPTT